MLIDLRDATVERLVHAIFHHDVPVDDEKPWFFGSVAFETDPQRQIELLAELFHDAGTRLRSHPTAAIEQGLWCMLGAAHCESFTGLVWDPTLPLEARCAVVASVYDLYDQLLAAPPYEAIDFIHPDETQRRFATIDYMVPDLLLDAPWSRREDSEDEARVETEFLALFERLLAHPAPVAQYAALHGLGHLQHPGRAQVIDRFLAAHPSLSADQRRYAEEARRGDVL